MAIYLTENFHLNSNQPFDVRMVVGSQSYYLDKDDIVASGYIYPGLRIWDFNTGTIGTPYVWTGTEWSSENDIGALIPSPSGNQNYIVKFVDDTTSLGRSSMYDDGSSIGIGLTAASIQPGTLSGLHVLGNIRTNGKFVGDGSLVTTINASNITSGVLDLDRIERTAFIPGTTYVLTQLNNNVTWDIFNTNPVITLEDSSAAEHFINFTPNADGTTEDVKGSTNLKYIPATQQILNGWGSAATPAYSFVGNTNKGMYWDNSGIITFTTGGNGKVGIFDGGVSISHDQYPQINFHSTTTTKSRLLFVNNSNNLLFRFDSTIVDDKNVFHDSNLYHLRQAPITSLETGRTSNGITINGSGQSIGGIYSYNLLNDSTMNTSLSTIYPILSNNKKYWSTIVIGNGANGGSFQIAGNFASASAVDREMLVRGLDSSVTSWSEWSRVCLNESNSFKWSMGKTHSTRDMLKIWMENNNPKFIITSFFDTGGNYTNTNSGNGFNIPYSPNVPSTTTTGAYDRYGVRTILQQARHNIKGYDIYYAMNSSAGDNGVYFCMFKNPTFNSATMREWTLLDAISANIIWTPASLSSGGGGHYSSPIIAPVTLGLNGALDTYISNKQNQAYPNGSATYGGFSTLRVHHDEDGNSVLQNTQVSVHLQPRFIQDIPI